MESFHLLLHTHWDLAPFVPEDATAFPLSAFRFPLSAFRFSPTVHGENERRSQPAATVGGVSWKRGDCCSAVRGRLRFCWGPGNPVAGPSCIRGPHQAGLHASASEVGLEHSSAGHMKTFFRILCVLATFLAASAPAATLSVKVQNLSFVPSDLTITNGDTVVFTGGNNFHTVTGDGASQPFCGSDLFTTCSVTFNQVGTYHYRCIPHAAVGMRGVIRVVSGVTSPLTVIIDGQGTVTPDLNGQALDVGNTYVLTAIPAIGFTFAGWTGGLTSSVARLSFVMEANLVLEANFVDSTAPAVTITAPSANTRLTNNTVTLHGTASDASGVAVVEYRVANAAGPGSFQTAAGTTTWSAVASDLVAGTNLFYVRAQDTPGNRSAEVTLPVLVLTRLTVTTNGAGTVSAGFLGTTFRDPGRSLSLTATPASGYLFTHWTGSIESSANPLSFVPASNMTLQANFELSPFPAINLSYNGLFYVDDQTNGVQQDSSGSFSFVLAKTGKYSGTLRQGDKRYAFSG